MDKSNGGMSRQQMQFIMNLVNYYDKNGEDKLVQDIFDNVARQKKQWKLTNEQIAQFVKNISPMLNAGQKEKLDGLVSRLMKMWYAFCGENGVFNAVLFFFVKKINRKINYFFVDFYSILLFIFL